MIIDFYTKNVQQQIVDEGAARKTSSFSTVNYDASAETIYFYNYYGSVIGEVPTTDFIIDGMIEDVYLSGSVMTIIFNTESGKKDIEVDLSEFFNPDDYYTKEETDELIDSAITESKSYTDTEIDKAINICNDYTDSAVTLLEDFVIDAVNSGITISNNYTDKEIDNVIDYVDVQVESAITRANEYTDEAIASLSGGSIEVDLHYDSGSTNAQAGTAVAEAIETRQEKMVNRGNYYTINDSDYLTGISKKSGVLGYQSLTFSSLRGWIVGDTTSVIDPEEPYKNTLIPNVQGVYNSLVKVRLYQHTMMLRFNDGNRKVKLILITNSSDPFTVSGLTAYLKEHYAADNSNITGNLTGVLPTSLGYYKDSTTWYDTLGVVYSTTNNAVCVVGRLMTATASNTLVVLNQHAGVFTVNDNVVELGQI